MHYKKTLSFILLSCFLLANVLPASAKEQTMNQDLSKAITQVKTTLGINTDLWDQFDYYVVERDQGNRWNLTWSVSTEPEQRLWVEIDQKGNIYHYNVSSDEKTHEGLGTLSEAQGLEKGRQFIKKVAPALLSQLVVTPAQEIDHNRMAFNYNFTQEMNGLPIKNALVTVTVDKYNGNVINYQVSDAVDFLGETFPAKDKAINLAAAKKTYLAQCGVELIYRSNYDYPQQTLTTYPVYRLKQSDLVIDALTGKVVSLQDISPMPNLFGATESAPAAKDAGGGNQRLTPQEQKAVDGLEKLITKDAALAVLPKMLDLNLEGYTVTESQLNKIAMDKERYMWSLNLSKPLNDGEYATIYSTVDAQSGQLLSFYRNGQLKTPLTEPETIAQAEQKVMDFLNKAAKDQLSQSQLVTSNSTMPRPVSQKTAEDYAYFSYQRMVNGVPYPDNGLQVTYDLLRGEIASYSCTWYKSATFADLSKVQTPDWIMDSISKQANYTLQYVHGSKTNSLVYDFSNKYLMEFDPFTGQALDWQGKPYQNQTLPAYQGLDGSTWAQSAQVLLDNGIYLNQTKLEPQKAISEKDFLTLLVRVDIPYLNIANDQNIIDHLVRKGVLAKGATISDQPLTRSQASTYVVKYLGYEPLALQPQAFLYPYVDAVDAKEKGYLAIAAALNFITPDSKNQLHPTAFLSLGESFSMIHQVAK